MIKSILAASAAFAMVTGAAIAQETDAEAAADAFKAGCEANPDSAVDCACVAEKMKDDPSVIEGVEAIRDQATFMSAPAEAQAVVMACLKA